MKIADGKKTLPRRLWAFLHSMRLAMALLLVLTLVCVLGSVVPQGSPQAYYQVEYGPFWAGCILFLQLDHVFSCWWFLLLTVFLCVNLVLCSVLRFPAVRKRWKTEFCLEKRIREGREDFLFSLEECAVPAEELFARAGFRRVQRSGRDEGTLYYAVRNRAGLWGSWLCHVGILLIIAGFFLGQLLSLETYVYGLPGDVLPVEGTPYTIGIDDFSVALREDYTVEQYTASLTVTNAETGESVSGQAQVNHPMDAFGLRLYQNSTGWSANVAVYRDGALLETTRLCAGEYLTAPDDPDLALLFEKFYPDYAVTDEGRKSLTPEIKNPYAQFSVYYESQFVTSDVIRLGNRVWAGEYAFVFSDPQEYTLIQVLRDPMLWLTALGGAVTLLALLLCFYLRTEEIWTVKKEGQTFLCGRSRKGAELLRERAEAALRETSKSGRKEKLL